MADVLSDKPKLRSFGDVTATRDTLFTNVQRALEEKFPISNERYTLRLAGVKYNKPKKFSNDEQKRALMRGQTLGWNLSGKWELVDNSSGKVVDKSNDRLIAQVPYLTDRGTFIFNGNEYTVASQMRLRPGVYNRVKDNGIIEAHFNVKSGTGRSFRVYMEPQTGVFRVNVGQANLKLYPLLRAMGIEDRALNKVWGADLLQANVAASDPRAVQRAHSKLVSRQPDTTPEKERDTDTIKTSQAKYAKSEVNYVMYGTFQRCAQCVNYDGQHGCRTVQGFISDMGWCVLWNPTFGKYAQAEVEEDQNRARARFIGELVCDDSKPGNAWAYLKVHKGLPEAAFEALKDQGIDCEPEYDHPHISVIRNDEAKQLIEKYGKKWKTVCGQGRKIPFSLQNAIVDLDPEGWKEMERVWFLEAKSPELRAYRKSLGLEELPRGDSGKEFQFHITVAVKPKKQARGSSKIASVFDGVEEHTKAAFVEIERAIDEIANDELIKSALADKLATVIDMSPPTEETEENEEPMVLVERQQQARRDLRGNPAFDQVKVKQDIHTLKKDLTTKKRYFGMEELKAMLPMAALKTAYQLFVGRERFYDEQGMTKQADDRQYGSGLRSVFEMMELDPNTTEMTLGKAIAKVSPELIVDVTKRLIDISRREADTDDRDSLAFQHVYGPEDLFAERIARDAGGISRKLLWRATTKGAVKNFPSGALSPQMRTVLLKSGLGAPLEEVNPLEIFDQQVRVTRMGEGGMPSLDAVPDEARSVQPSHFGVIDPIRAPEGMKIGVDSRVTHRTYKGADGNVYVDMLDVKKGKPTRISAQEMAKSVIAFPGEMSTKSKEVRAMIRGKRLAYVNRKEVDYELPHTSHMFTATSNMVPLVSAIKGGRLLMGAKMSSQSLPLRSAEAPLVQNLYDDGTNRSFEDVYGERMGAVRADGTGRVVDMSPSNITVKYTDGRKEMYDLYRDFPFNRKSVTGSTIIYVRREKGELYVGPIENYNVEPGDRTLTIDPATKMPAWLPILGRTEHSNDKKLLRIKMKSGRSFTVTEDHSLMIMGDAGELVPAYPDCCIVNETRLPVTMFAGAQQSCGLTVDEATLGGLYLAEGHIPDSHPNLINIAVAPDARAEQVMSLFNRLGVKPYRNGGNVCANDESLATLLKEHFGHMSHGKFISPKIFDSTIQIQLAVISGYFGGDGCLNADTNGAIQLYAYSVSKQLRDDLSLLLSANGIFTTHMERANEEKCERWRRAYGLRVTNGHIPNLGRWMFYDDREELLRQLLAARAPRSSPFEAIPVPRGARKLLYDGFRDRGEKVPHFVYKTVCEGYVARHRAAKAAGVFGAWGNSIVWWDTIEDIEPAPHEETVYDLSVAGAESFAVNGGIVVHNTYFHNTPTVKIGDAVSKGTLLAKSNFTDDNGAVATGLNLRVGYAPYRGYNADDAIVISESAAKKLSSEHMYTTKYKEADNYETGKNAFLSIYPGTFDKQQMKTISPKGVVKPGTKVEYGDPLVLAISKRKPTGGGMLRTRQELYSDVSETWDHESPGVVTDVDKTKDGWKVSVKAYSPMHIGDKLSNRYGGKGVVSKILPDDKMPHDKDGQPLEIMLNPLGIVSRTNPAQLIETVLGKVAKKTGHVYKLPGFSDENYVEFAKRELGKHGLNDTEDIYDPTSGRKIPKVLTGYAYMMKLHHMAEPKSSGRDIGSYTSEGVPAGGGQEGSKRIGMGEMTALISHGATEVIRDAKLVRGQRNDNFWRALRLGYTPPSPKVPMVYEKFISYLQGSGINLRKNGETTHLLAMTDKDTTKMSAGPLKKAETVTGDKLDPVKGGLFDVGLTGGHGGTRWTHIDLAEPLPNPVMEEPIRRMLGVTRPQLMKIIGGKEELHGQTGPKAILAALKRIKLDDAIEQYSADVRETTGANRDNAIKVLGYLQALKKNNQKPEDLMVTKVPVLPPNFRPITAFNKMTLVSDPNYLYLDLMKANDDLRDLRDSVGEEGTSDERVNLYNAYKAVTGLGDPVGVKSQDKQVRGLLADVFGGKPKFGMYQRRVLGAAVDVVGRGVITPNPSLGMDQVGLPEDKAWVLFRPFVVRNLVRRGMAATDAARHIENESDAARKALLEEMAKRPVIINRAPVLHRYGMMASWAVPVKGNTLQVPPITTSGFNADFDGDAMNYHVPVSKAAVDEAVNKMMPSRNLLAVSDFDVHYFPRQEFLHGLHLASTARRKGTAKNFVSKEDIIKAYNRGELSVGDTVQAPGI